MGGNGREAQEKLLPLIFRAQHPCASQRLSPTTPRRRSAAENVTLYGSAYIPGLTTAQLGECLWASVCACERERVGKTERGRESASPACFASLILCSSLSLPSLAPVLLPAPWLLSLSFSTRSLYRLFSVSLLSPSSSTPLSRCPLLLRLSLAVHHSWRWMSQRLKPRRLCPHWLPFTS